MTAVSNNDLVLAAITSALQKHLPMGGKNNLSAIVCGYYDETSILEAFKSLKSTVSTIGSAIRENTLEWKLWERELDACTTFDLKIAQIQNARLRFAEHVIPRNRIETDVVIIPAVRLRPDGRGNAEIAPVCLVSNQQTTVTSPLPAEHNSNRAVRIYNDSFHNWGRRVFEPLATTTAQIRFYLLYNQAIYDITIRDASKTNESHHWHVLPGNVDHLWDFRFAEVKRILERSVLDGHLLDAVHGFADTPLRLIPTMEEPPALPEHPQNPPPASATAANGTTVTTTAAILLK